MATLRLVIAHAWLVLLASFCFLVAINWGLPSSSVDKFLYGNRTPWTGKEILALAGPWIPTSTRGSDVDPNPLDRTKLNILNDTDAKRAEIIRRYHLYSYQPDEMITFRALAQMNPAKGKLDPRLYQYGGLWIYPVGALLKIASALHLITLTPDPAFYLDHPEAFGRFYVVARMYSAAWGILGALAVFHLARRFTPSLLIATATATSFIFMPAVVNLAHEAKPHLPASVLMLLSLLAAFRYLRTGLLRDAILTGALCGAASGMLISAVPIFAMLPVMSAIRARWSASPRRHLIITGSSIAAGLVVYCITNPYVPINLLTNSAALKSNLSNSAAMYHPAASSGALATSAWLIFEAVSPFAAASGLLCAILVARRIKKETFLFLAPALLILIQFIALAAGKPGEYARFALFPDILLTMTAILGIAHFAPNRFAKFPLILFILGTQSFHTLEYLQGFAIDTGPGASRRFSASYLSYMSSNSTKLLIEAEPAPYILPPVDLFHWELLLPPRSGTIDPNAYTSSVRTLTWHQVTPMSWANIFFVLSDNAAPPLTADPKPQ
jgi:hypothetical protein